MSPFRYRDEPPYIYAEDEDESPSRNALYIAIGAAAGFAAGVLMAERFGGFKGLTDRLKDTFGAGAGGAGEEEEEFDYEGLDEDEFDSDFDDETSRRPRLRSTAPKSWRNEFSRRSGMIRYSASAPSTSARSKTESSS